MWYFGILPQGCGPPGKFVFGHMYTLVCMSMCGYVQHCPDTEHDAEKKMLQTNVIIFNLV